MPLTQPEREATGAVEVRRARRTQWRPRSPGWMRRPRCQGGRGPAHVAEGGQELEPEQEPEPEGGAGLEQEQEVPPPPPQPNLTDVMAVQTQLMQTITQLLAQNNNNNNHRGQHRNVPEGFQKKVENFNKLRPPTFDHSTDPMDADNWLREIEKKLELIELTEEECVTVAAH
jgi:hypothetical protein